MRFLLLLLPILALFSFRDQNQLTYAQLAEAQSERLYRPFEIQSGIVTDVLSVQNHSFKKDARLFLFDVSGKLVHQENLIPLNTNTFSEIDLSELDPGIYFVQLKMKNYSSTKKIIKN